MYFHSTGKWHSHVKITETLSHSLLRSFLKCISPIVCDQTPSDKYKQVGSRWDTEWLDIWLEFKLFDAYKPSTVSYNTTILVYEYGIMHKQKQHTLSDELCSFNISLAESMNRSSDTRILHFGFLTAGSMTVHWQLFWMKINISFPSGTPSYT